MVHHTAIVMARKDNRLIDLEKIRLIKPTVSKVPQDPEPASILLLNTGYLCRHVRGRGELEALDFDDICVADLHAQRVMKEGPGSI